MPVYEYTCSACGNRTDILHGINEAAPHFCPECGAEGTLRKGFAPPAIVFKGSGWAKKDRSAASRRSAGAKASEAAEGGDGKSSDGKDAAGKTSESTDTKTSDSRRSDDGGSKKSASASGSGSSSSTSSGPAGGD